MMPTTSPGLISKDTLRRAQKSSTLGRSGRRVVLGPKTAQGAGQFCLQNMAQTVVVRMLVV